MDQDFEEILNRLNKMEIEIKRSNDMLESIQRRARLAILFSSVKWFVIVGFSFGLFYYTKPYMEQTLNMYQQVTSLSNAASSTANMFDTFKSFLK